MATAGLRRPATKRGEPRVMESQAIEEALETLNESDAVTHIAAPSTIASLNMQQQQQSPALPEPASQLSVRERAAQLQRKIDLQAANTSTSAAAYTKSHSAATGAFSTSTSTTTSSTLSYPLRAGATEHTAQPDARASEPQPSSSAVTVPSGAGRAAMQQKAKVWEELGRTIVPRSSLHSVKPASGGNAQTAEGPSIDFTPEEEAPDSATKTPPANVVEQSETQPIDQTSGNVDTIEASPAPAAPSTPPSSARTRTPSRFSAGPQRRCFAATTEAGEGAGFVACEPKQSLSAASEFAIEAMVPEQDDIAADESPAAETAPRRFGLLNTGAVSLRDNAATPKNKKRKRGAEYSEERARPAKCVDVTGRRSGAMPLFDGTSFVGNPIGSSFVAAEVIPARGKLREELGSDVYVSPVRRSARIRKHHQRLANIPESGASEAGPGGQLQVDGDMGNTTRNLQDVLSTAGHAFVPNEALSGTNFPAESDIEIVCDWDLDEETISTRQGRTRQAAKTPVPYAEAVRAFAATNSAKRRPHAANGTNAATPGPSLADARVQAMLFDDCSDSDGDSDTSDDAAATERTSAAATGRPTVTTTQHDSDSDDDDIVMVIG